MWCEPGGGSTGLLLGLWLGCGVQPGAALGCFMCGGFRGRCRRSGQVVYEVLQLLHPREIFHLANQSAIRLVIGCEEETDGEEHEKKQHHPPSVLSLLLSDRSERLEVPVDVGAGG